MNDLQRERVNIVETEKFEPSVRTTQDVDQALNDIDVAEEQLGQLMQKYDWSDDFSKTKIITAFREAIINAVFHGNYGVSKVGDMGLDEVAKQKIAAEGADKIPGEVKVEVKINKDFLEITVQDFGQGFDLVKIADPLAEENLYKTSGRGMLMMQDAFDEIKHGGPRNQIVTLRKNR